MAYDKVIDSALLDEGLTATANAIRAKTGGSSPIAWDSANGFKAAVEGIDTEGGVELPELGDTAAQPSDIAQGKVLYDDDGNPVTGTVPTVSSLAFPTNSTSVLYSDSSIFATGKQNSRTLIDSGATIRMEVSAGKFGNAKQSQVLEGTTFTSSNGLCLPGTMKASGGVVLPELGETAAQPTDIVKGKTLYDDNGNPVTGEVDCINAGIAVNFAEATVRDDGNNLIDLYKGVITDVLLRENSIIHMKTYASSFGNATEDYVAKDISFTSKAGLRVKGVLEEIIAGESVSASENISVKRNDDETIQITGKINWGDYPDCIVRDGAYLNITASESDFDGIFETESSENTSLNDFIQGQITTIQNEDITEVGRGTFAYTNIENIDLPNCTIIREYAFANCSSLKDINLPQCKDIKNYAFYQANIEELTLPEGEVFGFQCFGYSKIKTIILPISREVGTGCFYNCSLLTNIEAPFLENIGNQCFQNCTSLKEVQFNSLKKISSSAFIGSINMFYMTLLPTEKVTLEGSNAFLNTPFASGKGYIFVPAEIIDTYKQDGAWKKYEKRIFAIAPIIIEPSQSIIVEQTRSKDYSLDLKFFDSVPEVSFSNSSICEITNKEITQNGLSFTLKGINLGEENITIIATAGEQQATLVLPIEIIEKLPYEVNNRSATYGFYLNDNNYYESNNKGKNTSYAVCRVTFTLSKETQVYLDCINYAENTFDYGILSNIDTELSLSNIADTSENIYKNFRGSNSSSVQTVTYTIPAGEHFIDIKYLKDQDNSSNNDSLQFKIRFE